MSNKNILAADGIDTLSINADGSINAMDKIREYWRKCNGNIDKYKRPIMKELLDITNKDNFKAIKLWNHLRKKQWKPFCRDAKKFTFKQTLDGLECAPGNKFLIAGQLVAKDNGVYVFTTDKKFVRVV